MRHSLHSVQACSVCSVSPGRRGSPSRPGARRTIDAVAVRELTTSPSRRRTPGPAAAVLLGALAGAAAKAADESGLAWAADWATRRRGVLPGAVLALAAGVVLTGGAVRQLWWTGTGVLPDALARPVQAGVEVAVVLVLTVLVPRRLRTRLWALALLLPMAWLAERLLDLLRQLLSLG
jgi:hypothetical protein